MTKFGRPSRKTTSRISDKISTLSVRRPIKQKRGSEQHTVKVHMWPRPIANTHYLYLTYLRTHTYIYKLVGIYSDVVVARMAITYSIWEVDNCTSNPALALNERTAENLGGKEDVINCLHIKGSWTGLLMNHPPVGVHKRFSRFLYIRWCIYVHYTQKYCRSIYYYYCWCWCSLPKHRELKEGAALQLYTFSQLLMPIIYCIVLL